MPSPYIELFMHDATSNPGEDLLLFWTGPGAGDPEYEAFVDRDTFTEIDDGFIANPLLSNTRIEFHFFNNRVAILYVEKERYIFTTSIRIHPDAREQFYRYARQRIQESLARRMQELSYVNEIKTKNGKVGLVENVEGRIGEYLTGVEGSMKQQANKLRKKMTRKNRRRLN